MSSVGSGGGAPAGGSAVPATSSGPAAVEEVKEEVKEEKEAEESDDDMVCTLFNFQYLQVSLTFVNILLHHRVLDFSINLLFYIRFLGEFVPSLVRCGITRVHVLTPCQIF